MNRFYIKKLMVSGGGHHTSVIDFKPGLNFILGPSNTGKSLVMDCLDYMFGFTPKKNKPSKIVDNNNGYEWIPLQLATANGTVILERKIGESKITVSGSDPTVEHGKYSVGHTDKKNIINPFGRKAHNTAIATAISGFFSFDIYPMLALSIRKETNAITNRTAGTRYVSYLL